ncbi:MAG: TetR/AcrR family transcriptional regulator [Actinobacteria bacterium]|nr:TetR/AcrR family transcriptional regulator [Actinomycetota bacterium]
MKSAVAPEPPLTRGHKKKSRTRRLLLDAAVSVLADRGEGFSIADVATAAGVSHGTFYNYFADRDELLDALVAHTVEEFASVSAREIDEPDPAMRFARISARALATAVESPHAVRFTLRLEAVQRALLVEGPLAHLRQDLVDGHRSGRFPEAPDDATLDVVLGALLLAARRVIEGETGADYRRTVIRRLLMSLGVAGGEADQMARLAVG